MHLRKNFQHCDVSRQFQELHARCSGSLSCALTGDSQYYVNIRGQHPSAWIDEVPTEYIHPCGSADVVNALGAPTQSKEA